MCLTTVTSSLRAATKLSPEEHNFISLYGSVGYTGMLHNLPEVKTPSGVAPAFGVGYRFYRNNLILHVGVEGQYQWMKHSVPEQTIIARMQDADIEPEPFTMTISVFNRVDIYKAVNVNIPFYLGYEGERFYAMAGAAAGIMVYGVATNDCEVTTVAKYDRLIGEFEDMPNHGMSHMMITSGKQTYRTKFNLMLHAEMGLRLGNFDTNTGFQEYKKIHRIYLGAFADYGVLSVNQNAAMGDMLSIDYSKGVRPMVVPMMLSNEIQNRRINPLTVGLKLTVLIELLPPGKSHIYDNNAVDRNYRKRGGNQVIH